MKIAIAAAGLLTAAAVAACGSSGGGSSGGGHSDAYNQGYQAGQGQVNAPAGAYTDPQTYCGAFSVSQGGGN